MFLITNNVIVFCLRHHFDGVQVAVCADRKVTGHVHDKGKYTFGIFNSHTSRILRLKLFRTM